MDITELLAFSAKMAHLTFPIFLLWFYNDSCCGRFVVINLPAMEHKDVHRLVYDIMNDKQRRDYEEFYRKQTFLSKFRSFAFSIVNA